MKALVVEDDEVSGRLVASILEPSFEVCRATDGGEAFDLFTEAFDSGAEFDLICLDIGLPEIDGVEFLSGLRAYEEERGVVAEDGVKVIIITGSLDTKTVFDAMTAGCTAYMTKPLDRGRLIDELMRLGFDI